MLRRMTDRKEIRCWKIDIGADWFLLNSTPKKLYSRYYHEVAAADLFTAFLPHFKDWIVEQKLKEDRVDRGILVNGKPVYFEVDMGTENISVLYEKVENAIRETSYRFHVVYVFAGEEKKAQDRARKLGLYLAGKKRGDQFVIASHPVLINNPLGEVIFTPKGELKSINALL